jgi:adenosylhomocysteine nucleosidase
MKIALQFAMPFEFECLPGAKDLKPFQTISGIPFYQLGTDLMAACGGVGKVNAAMCAQVLCRHFKNDLILNAGVAGCCTDLPIGSLVLADTLVQHDVDTTAVGDPIGLVSTVNVTEFSAWEPDAVLEILKQQGVAARTGRVASGDWFATKGERSRRIVDTFHPTVVEMEACAIAQVCLRNDVRFVALKSVSDHLFSEKQAEEYFDFGEALKKLGAVVLPLAEELQKKQA